MQSALLLDVVVREGSTILQLLPGEDQPLLVWGDSLLVLQRKLILLKDRLSFHYKHSHLDLGLHVFDGVAGFDFQGDRLAGESLHENLHSAAEPEDKVESTLLLDIVVREGPPIFQLLASEDQPLLVRGDSLLVLQRKLKL